ncbi:hypothetical protein DRQ33_07180 [bacterium]|nr:MAG: hypothetical protein DRQ33_07180 [bacterium]
MKIIALIIFFVTSVFAQNQLAYIAGEYHSDFGIRIIQTFDGGYAIIGQTISFGAGTWDIFLLKFSPHHSLEWAKTYGGDSVDVAFDIIQTPDSGYAFTGLTRSFGVGLSDAYIAKVDSKGSLQSFITFGGVEREESWDIETTTDNGFIISGCTESYGAGLLDILFAKFDSSLSVEWIKTVGSDSSEYSVACVQANDTGFAIVASSKSAPAFPGKHCMLVVKLDKFLAIEWAKGISGDDHDHNYGNGIIQTTDGGYSATGKAGTPGVSGGGSAFLVKLDSTGMLQWSKTIGTIDFDKTDYIIKTYDNGYVLSGYTGQWGAPGSDEDLYDFFITKLDSSGSLEWARKVGDEYIKDWGYSVIQTSDSGYAMVGKTMTYRFSILDTVYWNLLYVKFDSNGDNCIASDITSDVTVDYVLSTVDDITSIIEISDISPDVMDVTAEIIEMDVSPLNLVICETSTDTPEPHREIKSFTLNVFPNPFNSAAAIQFSLPHSGPVNLKIFDVYGIERKTLANGIYPAGNHYFMLNGNNLSSGIYFCKLTVGNVFSQTKKILFLK